MRKEDQIQIDDDISLLSAQFKSAKAEHSFRQHALDEDKKRAFIFIFISLMATVLLICMEFRLYGISGISATALVLRIFWITGCFGIIFFALNTRNENHFDLFLLLFSSLLVVLKIFMGSLNLLGDASSAVGDIIIILGLYLILPTRILYRIIPAVALTFFTQSILADGILIAHHMICHMMGFMFANILSRSKRIQFLLFLKENQLKKELEASENEVVFISEKLAEQNKILKDHATKDQLTGIHNRRSFCEFSEEQWSKAVRKKEDCCIILIDIDHFKQINDNYGHLAGDMVLKSVVNVIEKLVRPYDRFGRWGGEEFIIYLPETDIEQALKVAERFRAAVETEQFHAEEQQIQVTISLGVSGKAILNTTDLDVMFDKADKALYAAKASGRNKVCHYHDMSE